MFYNLVRPKKKKKKNGKKERKPNLDVQPRLKKASFLLDWGGNNAVNWESWVPSGLFSVGESIQRQPHTSDIAPSENVAQNKWITLASG